MLFRSILKYKMDWNNRGNPLFVGLGSYSYRKESAPSILFSVREQSQAKEPNSKQLNVGKVRPSMARTLMARLPWLFVPHSRSCVTWKNITADLG